MLLTGEITIVQSETCGRCAGVGAVAIPSIAIAERGLSAFTVDVADRMIERYKGIAARLVIYLASHWREVDPKVLERWGEVARAVRKAA